MLDERLLSPRAMLLFADGVADHLDISDLLPFAQFDDCLAVKLAVDRLLDDILERNEGTLQLVPANPSCLSKEVHLDECRSRWHDKKRRHLASAGCFSTVERAQATSAATAALGEVPYSIGCFEMDV